MKTTVDIAERDLRDWPRSNEVSRRLEAISGVGVLTATALAANLGDGAQFRNGRKFSDFLGLVPRRSDAVGPLKLGRISNRGNRYLRTNLVHGARSASFWRLRRGGPGALRPRTGSESTACRRILADYCRGRGASYSEFGSPQIENRLSLAS